MNINSVGVIYLIERSDTNQLIAGYDPNMSTPCALYFAQLKSVYNALLLKVTQINTTN